jgi:phosphohistidine swiveling domain-containing protein
MEFKAEFLSKPIQDINNIKYKVIENIQDCNDCKCIIVKTLSPDYALLLDSIDLIICETGSVLSHLAIIAREHNKPIILIQDIIEKIPKSGDLSINNNIIKIK